MSKLESWVFRIADNDRTWFGLNWLRPAKHDRVSIGYIFFSSTILGLPGIAAGAACLYLFLGKVPPHVLLAMFVLAMLVEVPLHVLFAYFWNRRARTLAAASGSS